MKLIIVSYEEYIIFSRASVNSSTDVGGPLPFDKGGNARYDYYLIHEPQSSDIHNSALYIMNYAFSYLSTNPIFFIALSRVLCESFIANSAPFS